MVAKQSIIKAKDQIERVLNEFVHHRASDKIHVFDVDISVNEWGHLEVIMACEAFKGMSIVERQDRVWDYLREKLGSDVLAHLSQIRTMDHEEYDASTPGT